MSKLLDFIGDVHGHYDDLVTLLDNLGYNLNTFTHPSGRKPVFLGDLIDRGPKSKEVVTLVKKMHDQGLCKVVMGNHEFNAVNWTIPDPKNPKNFLHQHNTKNIKGHTAFLSEYENDEEKYLEHIEWFKTLPLFIDEKDYRAVHACFHEGLLSQAKNILNEDNSIPEEIWTKSKDKTEMLYHIVEAFIKNPEFRVPDELSITDESGNKRSKVRLNWWKTDSVLAKDILITTKAQKEMFGDTIIPELMSRYVYLDETPVFFGHHWFYGELKPINSKLACLDYSVANTRQVVGYRWSGENKLVKENFSSSR